MSGRVHGFVTVRSRAPTGLNGEAPSAVGSAVLQLDSDEITEGPLLRTLLVLAVPLLAQKFVQVANQVVDLFFLGRLSEASVAGVSLATPAIALLFALAVYTPVVGSQVLVSQHVGADDESGTVSVLGAGLFDATAGGVLLGGVAFLVAPLLADRLVAVQPADGSTAVVWGFAVDYLRVVAAGLVAVALAYTVEAAFVGWGERPRSSAGGTPGRRCTSTSRPWP